jgi:hypothetical protein
MSTQVVNTYDITIETLAGDEVVEIEAKTELAARDSVQTTIDELCEGENELVSVFIRRRR